MSADIKAGLQGVKDEQGEAYSHLKNLIANMARGQHGLDAFEQ